MKKCFKKALSGILASAMLLSSVAIAPTSVFAAPSFGKVGGWFESIYAEIPGISDADVTGVSYSGTASGSLTGQDLDYLVRAYNGGVRIDIPGLQEGTYTLTVNTADGNVTKENLSVMAYDRSGYAHFDYSEGVGAYNNDGTPKDNAIVLYVTEENKNDVTLTYNGKTVKGIGNILNSRGATGTVTNTNQQILKDLATDNVPLIVRIVGDVKAGDSNTSNNPPAINIEGLTAYDSTNYGGTEGDNGMMARIQDAKDITIEGIGPDASINGWGIHFVCGTAAHAAGAGKSCEIRNIYFQNYPEDAFGAEGQQDGSTLTAPVERIWVHNNNFGPGYCKNPTDSDKAEGDGSCDFKRGQYYTMAYNKYWDCHKTNLIGSSDSSLQFFMTMHHNYYENCMARGPLARQGNIHMYNNVYIGQTDYAMNTRANAYIFSEYNLFYMCKNPMRVDAGAIKSYNDSLSSCIEEMGGTVVTDRSQKVSSGNKYENFDTDPSLSYIPNSDYVIQEDITEAKKVVMAYTGVMKEDVVTPDEVSVSLVDQSKQPANPVSLPWKNDLTDANVKKGVQTLDNVYISASKVASDGITLKEGQAIVFAVNTNVNITITDGGASYPVALLNESGEACITGSGTAYNLPAGTYFIQPTGFSPAKGGEEASFKESKISFLGIEVYDPNAPTVEYTTSEPTTQDPDATTTTKAQGGDVEEPDTEETTEGVQGDPVLMGTYVFGDNASGGDFNIKEKKSAAGNMTIELRDVSDDGARVRKDDGNIGIAFNLTQEAEITVDYSGKGIEIYNTITGVTITFADGESPQSAVLEPGNYSISGNNTGSNSTISQIVLTATGSTPSETSTEAQTEVSSETQTETSTEAQTETSTEAPEPVGGVTVSVGEVSGVKVGETITVPVLATGLESLANYDIDVNYDSSKLEVVSVTNGDMIDVTDDTFVYNTAESGVVSVSAVNTDAVKGDVLFNITFRATAEGTANVTLTVNELFAENLAEVEYTVDNGSVAIEEGTTPSTDLRGDAYVDGVVDAKDAAAIMKYVAGIITGTESGYDFRVEIADYNEDGEINIIDAVDILRGLQGDSDETTEATTVTTTETTTVTTTEEDTETTTEETVVPEDGVIYNSMTLSRGTNDSYVTVYNDKESDGAWKVDKASGSTVRGYLMIKLGKTADITITGGGEKAIKISQTVGEKENPEFSAKAAKTVSFTNVPAGTWYIYNTDGNMTIDSIVVTMDGSTPVEPPTEGTTEAVTEEPTEATTAEEEPSEPTDYKTIESAVSLDRDNINGNEYFNVAGHKISGSGEVQINNTQPIVFTVAEGANVSVTARHASSSDPEARTLTLTNSNDEVIGTISYNMGDSAKKGNLGTNLPAGTYTITASNSINITSLDITFESATDPDTPSGGDVEIVDGVVNIAAGDTDTLLTAIYTIEPGDTINLEPGTYVFPNSSSGTTAQELQHKIKMFSDNSGTADAPKTLTCEDGYAVLDFTSHDEVDNYRGIQIDGDYWNVSNMHVKGAGDNGMLITGDYINVDNCIFEGNHDTGLQISRRGSDLTDMADWPHDITITNCTSFDNIDEASAENADGFAAKLTCGENIVFDNCIAYNNSDDGWDLFTKGESGPIGAVTIKNCVAFNNGKLTDGSGSAGGDMNGFKLGGEGIAVPHVVENCVAFNNGACGFTDNNNPGVLTLINCTAYGNGQYEDKANFNTYRTTDGSIFKKCVSYNTNQTDKITNADMTDTILYNKDAKYYVLCNGSYANEGDVKNEPQASISDSDFVSLELPYTDLSKVHEQMRNADGSINMKGFLEIASSSEFAGMGAKIN